MQQAFTYRLLVELLNSLEAEGYPIGTGQHLRMQELLSQLPEPEQPEDLKHALAPLFARSPQQQEQFYRIFDQSYRRTKRYFDSLKTTEPASPQPVSEDTQTQRLRWLIAFLALALFIPPLIVFGLRYWEESSTPLSRPFNVPGGGEAVICIADSIVGSAVGQVDSFAVRYSGSGEYGSFLVDPPGCLTYIAQDSLNGQDSILIEFMGPQGQLLVNFKPIIQQPGEATEVAPPKQPERKPEPSPQDSVPAERIAGWFPKNLPYQHDLFAYSVDPPSWLQQQLARYKQLLKLGGFLLGYGLLLALFLYRFRKRQTARLPEGNDKPPYAWHIKMPGVEDIELGPTFQRLLNRMRTRTRGEAFELDIPSTISSTIEKGGMTDFQYRQQTRPPEYLILIDQQSRRNHRSQVFNYATQKLRANEVLIERFYYDGDPRICYNELYPEGVSIAELQQRYSQARLFMIGSGHAFIHKMTGKLVDWAEVLTGWKERALFSPKPFAKWGRRERRLGQLCHVLPLQLESLEILLEAYEVDEVPTAELWQQRLSGLLHEPIQLEGPLMATLQQHYDKRMLQWIAACAVLPNLHWHLTLYWGRHLSSGEEQLLTLENVQELCRLPWFVQGTIPDYARLQLAGWLEAEYPDLLRDIRQQLIEILGQHAPPTDSAAFEDYRMQAALNEYLTVGSTTRRQQLAEEVSQLMDMGNDIDLVVEEQLNKRPKGVGAWLPQSWQQRFYRQGMPALGFENLWGELRWLVPALLIMTGIMSMPWPLNLGCEGPMAVLENPQQKSFLCLTDQQAWGLYLETRALQHLGAQPLQEAMPTVSRTLALLQGNGLLRFDREDRIGEALWRWYLPLDGASLDEEWGKLNVRDGRFSLMMNALPDSTALANEIRANLSVSLYNLGAKVAEEAEATDADSLLHSQACAYFSAALAIGTIYLDVQRLRDWCGGKPGIQWDCKVLTQKAVLRAQDITEGKMAAIEAAFADNGQDVELDYNWFLKPLEENQTVSLLGESPYAYQVIADGIPGYLPKRIGSDSILQDCGIRFYTLRGRVVDASGLRGVSDVRVQLDSFTVFTNGEGAYNIRIPRDFPAGPDSIRFSHEGFDPAALEVVLPKQSVEAISMTRLDDPAKRFLTLRATVENFATADPIAEALVQTPSGEAFRGRTDQNGEVEVVVPYLGTTNSKGLRVQVSKPGFKTAEYFVTLKALQEGLSQSFVLKPNDEQVVDNNTGGKEQQTTNNYDQSRYLWCLDAPHGKEANDSRRSPVFDDGKTVLYEADLSRDLVKRIKTRLQQANIDFFEVVTEETDISLRERARRINEQPSNRPKMVLSLHFLQAPSSKANAPWSDDKVKGVEAWPKPGDEQSARLAAICMEYVMRQTGLRNRSIKYSPQQTFTLLEEVRSPIVQMENGVISNRSDAAQLAQPAFRQKLANAYVDAIIAIEENGLSRTPAPLISEQDSDKDGIDNRVDRCPFEPAPNQEDGCPAEAQPQQEFEEALLRLPTAWSNNASQVMNLPYSQIYTYLPDQGVRGRYAVLKSVLNPQVLERLIGEPVFLSGPHDKGVIDFDAGDTFGRYNPAFLSKLEDYLRTGQQNDWLVKQLSGFYNEEFRDLLRLFFDMHEFVEKRPKLAEDFERLLRRDRKEREANPYAINDFFLRELGELRGGQNFLVDIMAVRFWVRRSVDGTADEFYSLLRLTLDSFDPGYTDKVKGKGLIDKK
jgi:N-acetylmuramoyl-L-alanine amidase